jgi:hypothetical protein
MENMPMDNLVPTTGNSASVIDRLLEYIPKFDPDFSNRISGAPSDMISLYSKLAGFGSTIDDIPIAYANFLRSMGINDGGFLKNLRLQAYLKTLINLYQDCLRSEPETLNPKLPIVATYIVGDRISFDQLTNRSNPEVVESADGDMRFFLLREHIRQDWQYSFELTSVVLHTN